MGKGTPRRNADLNNSSQPNSPTPKTPPASRPKTTTLSSPVPRGPTPSHAESSYHKRLRSLLVDHRKLRSEWSQLVLRGLVGRVRASIEVWVEIDNSLAHLRKAAGTSASGNKAPLIRATYLVAQAARLGEQISVIGDVLDSLEKCLEGMKIVGERAEGLVLEAATTRGTAFAFREPLWVTWPLAKFADGLMTLTAPYHASLELIRNLIDLLTTFPPLPVELDAPPIKGIPYSQPKVKDGKASQVEARPSAEEIQAAMSLLAVQPLIPGKGSESGAEAWEEVLAVEVGNWG